MPRIYRGRDIKWWMDAIGAMDLRYDAVDDIDRARRLPSLQLIGTPGRETIDFNSLRKAGVEIVGRLRVCTMERRSSPRRSRITARSRTSR